jgi:1-acyl-sn-glycerol-3-phosphate acyltransferase
MPRGKSVSLIYSMGKMLGRFCFGGFGKLDVTGPECVPPFGPVILIANHLSINDPPVLVATINRQLNFIAKQELFRNPVSRAILTRFGVHPFDRSGRAVDIIKLTLRLLAQDETVVLFPEGTRSPDHTMQKGLPGAAYIAMKSQATILPVGLVGTENFPSWRMAVPLCRIGVNIGQPFSLPLIEGRPNHEVLQSMADMMMSRIAALLPKKYQGVYALPSVVDPESAGPEDAREPVTG